MLLQFQLSDGIADAAFLSCDKTDAMIEAVLEVILLIEGI